MELYNKVRLLTDRYLPDGARRDDEGYVIEIYQDGNCEVEFSYEDSGTAYALIVAKPDELEKVE